MTIQNFEQTTSIISKIISALEKVIKGRSDTIKLVLTALVADGHVLLEDYPGSGKTTLAKTLGKLISVNNKPGTDEHILPFRRVQFTPDMLPGDVLGVNVFEPKTGNFRFIHGPVFAHILLADEINRTGPKVQAAFLECMAEKQVTIDNHTHKLDELFFVIGTQNPLDVAGTYPLPLVQLDRFLLKVPMSYVDKKTEIEILEKHNEIKDNVEHFSPVCSRDDILSARKVCSQVHVSPNLREAIVNIVQSTRNNQMIHFGASTRAAIMVQTALQGWSLINGRDYATEDDLKFITPFVLLHRLKIHAGAGSPMQALESMILPHIEELVTKGLK